MLQALGLVLCDLIWQTPQNYNRPDDGHCNVTGRRKMSVLDKASTRLTTHENSIMMWSFKGPKLVCVLKNLLEMKNGDGLHIMMLSISQIPVRIWVEFLIAQFILEVTFSIQLAPLRWVPTAHCAGRRGLNLLTAVRPVELTHCSGNWRCEHAQDRGFLRNWVNLHNARSSSGRSRRYACECYGNVDYM